MKFAIFLAAGCSFFFFPGCKKVEAYGSSLTKPASVEGTWHYVGYSGGLAGFPFIPVTSGGSYIQATGIQLAVVSDDESIQKCMTYQFEADSNNNYQLRGLFTASDTSIMLPMEDMKTYYLTLSNDTLTLYPRQCADCFVAYYTPSLKHFACTGKGQ